MKASVIISVYNHFEWLRLILDALRLQTEKDFEVVIGDDGSNEETVAAINAYIKAHPEIRIIHSWQPDEGWRKDKSLNRSVRSATSDYMIFIDGDCIPHPSFVEDHLALRSEGRVVAGRRVDLPKVVSDEIEKFDTLPHDYFKWATRKIWATLFKEGVGKTSGRLKRLVHFKVKGGKSPGMKYGGILGCNFSLYRKDLEVVNGFDERYLDPGTGEDSDLDERLQNAGIMPVKVSRSALMLHRCHPRLVFDSPRNMELFETARRDKLTWIPTGLNQTEA